MNRILCPIDFSEVSLNALEYAANLAQHLGCGLFVFNVFTESDFNKLLEAHSDVIPSYKNLKEYAEKRIATLVKETEEAFDISVDHDIRFGKLLDICQQEIAGGGVRMMVMGTKGVSNVTQAYLGSNTVKVMERVDVPLVIIPEEASFSPLKSIIYASDYAEGDKVVLQSLVEIALPFKSRIKVVHFTHDSNTIAKAEYQQFIDELRSFTSYDKLSFELQEIKRDVSHEIDHYVIQQNGDMLAILKRKRNFVEQLLEASVTKKLSYFTEYPMMVFKGS